MSTEGRVIVECQAQVFHAGSDFDLSPHKPQAITRWRRSVIGPAAEPHCLRFVRGHTQSQSLDRGEHADHSQFGETDGSVQRNRRTLDLRRQRPERTDNPTASGNARIEAAT